MAIVQSLLPAEHFVASHLQNSLTPKQINPKFRLLMREWTKNGISNQVFRENLGHIVKHEAIKLSFTRLCDYFIVNVKQSNHQSIDLQHVERSTLVLTNQSSDLDAHFVISVVELFIHSFDCQIWLILHYNNGDQDQRFVARRREGSLAYEFAMTLIHKKAGDIIDDSELADSRNTHYAIC